MTTRPPAATAASVFGLIASVFGTAFSYFIAQAYNGTPVSTLMGMGIMGLCGLACCIFAERGRLFGRDEPRPFCGTDLSDLRPGFSRAGRVCKTMPA